METQILELQPRFGWDLALDDLTGAWQRWILDVRSFLRSPLNIWMAVSSDPTERRRARLDRLKQGDETGLAGGPLHTGSPSERDQHLVDRVLAGDKRAYHQLVLAYQERVFMVVRGIVHNQEDAQDITQEVFIKAFNSLDSFKGQASFYTWVYRIAVNLCIDHRRRRGRRPEVSFDEKFDPDTAEGAELPDPHTYSPQRAYLDKELGQKIRQAMEGLPEEQRSALVLRELEGLSYKEIADVMDCQQGTVMSRLFYGRKKLQELLKDLL
ncbi:MAG: sigma-70 family RNA polymerase sigma factor [Myxococcota bacterium]